MSLVFRMNRAANPSYLKNMAIYCMKMQTRQLFSFADNLVMTACKIKVAKRVADIIVGILKETKMNIKASKKLLNNNRP